MAPANETIRPLGILLHRCETGATGADVMAAEAKAGLGYHLFIRRDGTTDYLYPPVHLVWHGLSWSRRTVGIALHGDFHPEDRSRYCVPTEAQVEATVRACLALWTQFGPLPIHGHTDLPFASTDPKKICPGRNLDVRAIQAIVFTRWAGAR